jgi:hypothetical protein
VVEADAVVKYETAASGRVVVKVQEGQDGGDGRGVAREKEEDPRAVKTSIPSTIHVRRLRGCVVAD